VVKNLGPQLSRMPGLAAMTVLPEGDVALVYNPVALASVYGARARAMTVALDQPVQHLPKAALGNEPALVLVVDDSITVRRVTQRFLQREGFRVELANDGLQALDKLRHERPAVVLSDIEMPRMDGFDLLRNIRGDAALKDLPVIMITSRIAEKHREHAAELGANHYLGKPYSEDALLALVRGYAKAEREKTLA
jgi:chemosensory pili system protein ChpA (sensor histidine kinase/response regulator)